MLFSGINTDDLLSFTEIVNLEKGIEIGSANYIEKQTPGTLPYIRVGTLLNNSYDTFCIDNNYKKCDYDDILIAFDGAPGRNSVGLTGIYSSGIYKISCADSLKGYVYFYINSPMCQKTIKEHSQGTTILHAGKSINLLQIPNPSKIITLNIFSILYNELIAIYKKQKELNETKDILLRKYFE